MSIRSMWKFQRIGIWLLVLLFLGRISSEACTGIYVGEECSENGSMYFGRSEDIADNYCKIFGVSPTRELPEGTYYEDIYGFKIPYSGHIYGYTYVKDASVFGEAMPESTEIAIGEAYAAAGINERGVSVSATVSIECNEMAGEADPLDAERGIREISIGSVLLGKAETARDGVEYLAKILDEYGAGECNSLMIGDRNEVWYIEILTGHQYIAVKMPKDKVSVQPNRIVLGLVDVSDRENVIASPNLVSLAKEHNFLVTDERGQIHISKTYAPKTIKDEETERYYQGVFYLSAEKYERGDLDGVQAWIQPNRKLSTLEVLRFLAYRGKGSGCYVDGGTASWAIGNNHQVECHIFEIRKNLPPELASIQWQALADAEYSLYIPYYSALVNKVNEKYAVDSEIPVKNSLNWVFSEINAICYDYRSERGNDLCGENIAKYFEVYQEQLIRNQQELDRRMLTLYKENPQELQAQATAIGIAYTEEIYQMASEVLEELLVYVSEEPHSDAFVPSAMKEHRMPSLPFWQEEEDMKKERDEKSESDKIGKKENGVGKIFKAHDGLSQGSLWWIFTGVFLGLTIVVFVARGRKK